MADDRESRALSKPARKRPAGRLSQEERALWEHAARDLKPIKGKKQRVHAALEDADGELAPPKRETHKPPKTVTESKQPAAARAAALPAKLVTVRLAAPPPTALDRRKARQIGIGKIEIEARIDLHGMRQGEAHTALRRFLMSAHASGRRWVLVITGKGAAARTALDERPMSAETERGVLRRNVPRWLVEPELAAIVVGYTAAAIRHGGEGALYVQLRRRGRPES